MRKTIKQLVDEVETRDEDFWRARQTKINARNKKRGSDMERKIARRVGGIRVPMSGSGAMKGDVHYQSPFGLILLECKYSALGEHAMSRADYIPKINIRSQWVQQIEDQAREHIGAVAGMLVFHYHNFGENWIVVPEWFLRKFYTPSEREHTYVQKKVFSMIPRHKLLEWLGLSSDYTLRSVFLQHPEHVYYIMDLDDFMAHMEAVEREIRGESTKEEKDTGQLGETL